MALIDVRFCPERVLRQFEENNFYNLRTEIFKATLCFPSNEYIVSRFAYLAFDMVDMQYRPTEEEEKELAKKGEEYPIKKMFYFLCRKFRHVVPGRELLSPLEFILKNSESSTAIGHVFDLLAIVTARMPNRRLKFIHKELTEKIMEKLREPNSVEVAWKLNPYIGTICLDPDAAKDILYEIFPNDPLKLSTDITSKLAVSPIFLCESGFPSVWFDNAIHRAATDPKQKFMIRDWCGMTRRFCPVLVQKLEGKIDSEFLEIWSKRIDHILARVHYIQMVCNFREDKKVRDLCTEIVSILKPSAISMSKSLGSVSIFFEATEAVHKKKSETEKKRRKGKKRTFVASFTMMSIELQLMEGPEIEDIDESLSADKECIEWVGLIAVGGFGAAFIVKINGNELVLKVLKNPGDKQIEACKKEFILQRTMFNHPDVFHRIPRPMYFFHQLDKLGNVGFGMELCKGGNLVEFLKHWAKGDALKIVSAIKEMLECLRDLQKMKKMEFIHKDLKPENLLVRIADSKCNIVVCDLGLSDLRAQSQSDDHGRTIVGTLPYNALECLKSGEYSKKSDNYAMGMCIYSLMDESLPLQDVDYRKHPKIIINEIISILEEGKSNMSFPRIEETKTYKKLSKLRRHKPKLATSIQETIVEVFYGLINNDVEERMTMVEACKKFENDELEYIPKFGKDFDQSIQVVQSTPITDELETPSIQVWDSKK
ncbi:hypothetical protein ADUPG1_009614 [Aduncisulcus paluster]|uniref:Protein kinase domain-containing protein n=1 Tax=Aduncisulcus paluster TaxID=2918883 RepID=A0ABQ5KW94_9EUKA|nr:hypothetical protein ADUPG1_009614 [Aduncisulcus paluster]